LHWGACEFILLRSWQANSVGKFVAATLGIFLLAILYEGLKYYREVLFVRSQQAARQTPLMKDSNGSIANATPVKLSMKEQLLNTPHIIQSVLHMIQIFISYMLMLLVRLLIIRFD